MTDPISSIHGSYRSDHPGGLTALTRMLGLCFSLLSLPAAAAWSAPPTQQIVLELTGMR
jgi:hypothetical protein